MTANHSQQYTPSDTLSHGCAGALVTHNQFSARLESSPEEAFKENANLRRFQQFEFSLRLGLDDRWLRSLAEQIEAATRPNATRSRIRPLQISLACLFANLVRTAAADPRAFVGISLGAEYFRGHLRRPFGRDAISRTIKFLRAEDLLLVKKGFSDREAHSTKIRATPTLERLIRAKLAYGNTIDGIVRSIQRCEDEDIIRLRTGEGERQAYADTEDTVRMRSTLASWNSFADSHWVDLAVRDDAWVGYYVKKPGFWDQRDPAKARKQDGLSFPDLTATRLHRVFNRGSFESGGRFYGGWWQCVPKSCRTRITINGQPTRELDYSGMQLSMLYAQVGATLIGDPYELPGVDSAYRDVIKRVTLTLINARRGQRTASIAGLPLPLDELHALIRKRHRPIAEYFNSDAGVWLQRQDSDIAEAVMTRMAGVGHLVLPVHDSFLVQYDQVHLLRAAMEEAFKASTGREAVLKATGSFVDDFLGCAPEQEISPRTVTSLMNVLTMTDFERYHARQHHRLPASRDTRVRIDTTERGATMAPMAWLC